MTRAALAALVLTGCSGPIPPPVMAPEPVPPVGPVPTATPHDVLPPPHETEAQARARAAAHAGWMPLHATGVPAFAERYPAGDGRGVLIAILDSGIDPGTSGLQLLPTGEPKLLDLRDFSGEGRISLAPVQFRRDTVVVGPHRLGGASRLRVRAAGPIWGGHLAEVTLGKGPAADLNGDGTVNDTLAVVAARGPSGWMVFVDRHSDGSLADDAPVRDYAVAREWFGWGPAGATPALGFAVNISDSADTPVLDLFFDSGSHGTHVAGIAAGHQIGGIPGFDGVAPGAMLLGLKIASNADGGVTVPGSMIRALEYAIAIARSRQLPLVVNLSFGVGNEEEGAARIDALIDEVLAAHPGVVMTVAASNDGPGLSTIGFPGSSRRTLMVGATQPLVFSGHAPDDPTPDPVAYFSSRGGELAGPDLVAPGTAYSTVPAFAAGAEQHHGTSMAAPHVAGLAARLASVQRSRGVPLRRATMHQALRVSARPVPGASVLDQGAGVPDVGRAYQWLAAHDDVPVIVAAHAGRRGRVGILLDGADHAGLAEFTLFRLDRTDPLRVRLRTDSAWLHLGDTATHEVTTGGTRIVVRALPQGAPERGVRVGRIIVEAADDEGLGPLAVIPVTWRVPLQDALADTAQLRAPPGAADRLPFQADTGRGLHVTVATDAPEDVALAALHEPGGQPFRSGGVAPAGYGGSAARFEIDAGDVVAGMYELVVVAPPTAATAAVVTVARSPVRLSATWRHDTLGIAATSLVATPIELRLRTALTGVAYDTVMQGDGRTVVRLVIATPDWASRVQVDTEMLRATWPEFTDFGVTIRGTDGRLLAESPMNYAFGRLETGIPDDWRGDSLVVHLSPAAADLQREVPWELAVRLRFTSDRPWALDDGGTTRAALDAGHTRRATFTVADWPLDIPAGYVPLITVVALEGDDAVWTRVLPLRGAGGPIP